MGCRSQRTGDSQSDSTHTPGRSGRRWGTACPVVIWTLPTSRQPSGFDTAF